MGRFHYSYSNGEDLLSEGAYMLRVLEAVLVFHPKSAWVIQDFCRSSGLELPAQEADINLNPEDCLRRICYAELVHERGRDGRTRLAVERYLTRKEALERNPGLAKVKAPADAPASKKLDRAGIGLSVPAATGANRDLDAEPDDIPF
jgi:hypothetical protein